MPATSDLLPFTSFFFATRLNSRMLLTRLSPSTTPTNQERNRWKPLLGGTMTDTTRNTSMAKHMRTLPVMLLLELRESTLKDCCLLLGMLSNSVDRHVMTHANMRGYIKNHRQ